LVVVNALASLNPNTAGEAARLAFRTRPAAPGFRLRVQCMRMRSLKSWIWV